MAQRPVTMKGSVATTRRTTTSGQWRPMAKCRGLETCGDDKRLEKWRNRDLVVSASPVTTISLYHYLTVYYWD
ncbi:hypothetical protein ACOSQ2_026290 [Xanthoceras sorbifolium]